MTLLSDNKIGFVNATTPLPFVIDVSSKQVKVRAGESAGVKLMVERASYPAYTSSISFITTSTMTPLGKFANASATFSPATINTHSIPIQVTLRIETEPTLVPGIYKVTAGATDGIILYLSTSDLIVENNNFQKTEAETFEIID